MSATGCILLFWEKFVEDYRIRVTNWPLTEGLQILCKVAWHERQGPRWALLVGSDVTDQCGRETGISGLGEERCGWKHSGRSIKVRSVTRKWQSMFVRALKEEVAWDLRLGVMSARGMCGVGETGVALERRWTRGHWSDTSQKSLRHGEMRSPVSHGGELAA